MIRSTLAAVPRRPVMLAAKAAVIGAIALVLGEIAAFGAFFAGQSVLVSPAPHATLGQPLLRGSAAGRGLPGPDGADRAGHRGHRASLGSRDLRSYPG